MSLIDGPVYERGDYAGFIRRTVALVFDFLFLVFLYVVVPECWYEFAPAEWVTDESYVWVYYGLFLFAVAYCVGLRMTTGGTLGYRVMRIRYASMFDEKVTWMSVSYRALITIFLLWTFAFDHLWILFDKHKQAWHDKVSGFYVIKCKARPKGTQQVERRLINFMMLTFPVWEPTGRSAVKSPGQGS